SGYREHGLAPVVLRHVGEGRRVDQREVVESQRRICPARVFKALPGLVSYGDGTPRRLARPGHECSREGTGRLAFRGREIAVPAGGGQGARLASRALGLDTDGKVQV